MEDLYLNNFRIALPVAFPDTRRPTRLPTFLPLWSRRKKSGIRVFGIESWIRELADAA